MAGDSIDDDEYVARLLKQDAVDASKKYSFVGLDAFHPKRLRSDAPKPNTNFLRHIIRQTDSHNAALLAREAKDSRARLRQLDTAKNGSNDRTQNPRSRKEDDYDRRERRAEGRGRHRVSSDENQDRRSFKKSAHARRASGDEGSRHRRRRSADKAERPAYRSDSRRESEHHTQRNTDKAQSSRNSEHRSRKRARERSVSVSRTNTRSPSPCSSRYDKASKRDRSPRSPRKRSRSPPKRGEQYQSRRASRTRARRDPSIEDDSDPLEAIVGPLPPPKPPAVRSRGRGARKGDAEGINARFSSTYDPAMDIDAFSDKGDDWGDAVEAYRDRQRWKQQGAERLKAAGFSEEQVKKWERGDEKTEEDVRWTTRGQAREWDRGKVVEADGDIGHKAAWADK
ncbi:uncharacterized protein CC84DRAFT_1204533 [Paraphaeosphaeria sporulosa]|uniref:Pre-mRNA-splicing factor 38B n=1 Tax=Paraphaeosphaeria sporulosa TaxID=1460663 RepID=A0A177CH18_9PLEO|nr:uncharacterized protein CC84DRAFT_1204533 [Paraphaeosphaeria sporulosa]OAG06863.1 hypothetical protein CC84DRAFT_1204533 [Paraphaeosphaeria sporulosa]